MVVEREWWHRPPSQEDRARFERAVYGDYLDGCGCEVTDYGEVHTICDFHRWVGESPEWFNRLVWVRHERNSRGTLGSREGTWLCEFIQDPTTYWNGKQEPVTFHLIWGAKLRGSGREH